MLKLLTPNLETSEAAIPVSWCVSQDTLEKLKYYHDSRILIAVFRKSSIDEDIFEAEDYQTARLADGLIYIRFSRPGVYRIVATIFAPNLMYQKEYKFITIDSVGCFWDQLEDKFHPYVYARCNSESKKRKPEHLDNFEFAELNVVVSEEFFARIPVDWKWVNFWFEEPANDQCHLRRRRFLVYSIQPLVLGLYVPICLLFRWLIGAYGILSGQRGVDFKPLVHPFRYSYRDILSLARWEREWGSVCKYDEFGEPRRSRFIRMLSPERVLGSLLLLGCTYWVWNVLPLMVWVYAGALILLIAFFCFLGNILAKWIGESIGKSTKTTSIDVHTLRLEKDRIATEKKAQKIQRRVEKEQAALREVSCAVVKKPVTLESLPSKRKSISLRFQDLKARVCKPFPK